MSYTNCRSCHVHTASSSLWKWNFTVWLASHAPIKGVTSIGRALLEGSLDGGSRISAEFRKSVISRMRMDNFRRIGISDDLIVKLGTMLLHKLGHKRATDISVHMRELSRLVIRIQGSGQRLSLSDLLKFWQCGVRDKHIAGCDVTEGGRRIFKTPALVIKVSGSLLKCAHLKQGGALRNGDSVSFKDAEDFITLHRAEFTDRLLSAAHASYRIRGNTLKEYPDESDLKQLKVYLQDNMTRLSAILRNWANMAWIGPTNNGQDIGV